jgi:hypothetical protein
MQLAAAGGRVMVLRVSLALALVVGSCAEHPRAPPENLPRWPSQPAARPGTFATLAHAQPKWPLRPLAPGPPAPLDVKTLLQRLQDTRAIGLFTKLSLKGQVDHLLEELRAYHDGTGQKTLTELRQVYDLLVMKVLALLWNTDSVLAQDLVASRERIWGLLIDPATFSTL